MIKAYCEERLTNQQVWEKYFRDKYCMKTVELVIKKAGLSREGGNYNWDTKRDYFKEIDTPEKAYILGYIQADGHSTGKVLRLECLRSDECILEFIRSEICPSANISYFTHKGLTRGKSRNEDAYMYIGCSSMMRDLEKYYIYPVKQCQDYPLASIPDKFYPDFIRGCFDGDGTVWNVKKQSHARIYCDRQFAEDVVKLLTLHKVLIGGKKYVTDMSKYGSNICAIEFASIEEVNNFYDYMYYDKSLFCLERKRVKFHKD